MAVEVARLGRKRFENVGAVDGPEVEGSVRPRSLVLSMHNPLTAVAPMTELATIASPSAIDRFMVFSVT
jgi:hypothetical protein